MSAKQWGVFTAYWLPRERKPPLMGMRFVNILIQTSKNSHAKRKQHTGCYKMSQKSVTAFRYAYGSAVRRHSSKFDQNWRTKRK